MSDVLANLINDGRSVLVGSVGWQVREAWRNRAAAFVASAFDDVSGDEIARLNLHDSSSEISATGLMIAYLEAKKYSFEASQESVNTQKIKPMSKNKVFIVHGRNDGIKETVARFIESTGLTAIILHEQASQSRTLIEKLEANSDVCFAVVILSPDDEGRLTGSEDSLNLRARQNVLIEWGYFLGKLGRENVFALKVGDTEIPSDFQGVIYTAFDDAGGWKGSLVKELAAAKLEVNLTALIR